ncbi:MAG: monovalent cation/H+ antiporter subunit D [Opitutaceae bacterium]|nr:monovalent cation/H+ antiporter subunit D [Opitutaceae bacterium]
MAALLNHLVILPILLPLATGALLLFFPDRSRRLKMLINAVATLLLITVGVMLVMRAADPAAPTSQTIYPLGNWPVPFGIVLVVDRFAALMVMLTGIVGACAMTYSFARWHAAGPNFHSLFQFLLMGLNGAFLTGDLFNLFVFFEVLLAASYGLALHGSGEARVKSGLHYIAINLAASSLFLIGAALIYGVVGTLNMADLAARVPLVPASDRGLLEAGAAILGVAFLVKAAMWPLGFWLPTTYAAASAPVAALFTIMTKVGIYAILRMSTLAFGADAGASAGFGHSFLLYAGLVSLGFGTIGVLASRSPARMAGYCVLVSSGTLLTAVGFASEGVTGAAFFYLVSSTLAVSAFFLVVDLLERVRIEGADVRTVTVEAFDDDDEEAAGEVEEISVAIPSALAVMSVCFGLCVLLIAGLPPLSGFVAKFIMLSAMLTSGETGAGAVEGSTWWVVGLLIVSGFATLIALTRTGINTFWMPMADDPAPVRVLEIAPVIFLLGLTVAMTAMAGPVMGYMTAAAAELHTPSTYISDVLPTALAITNEGVAR